jgi:hypothetical protein
MEIKVFKVNSIDELKDVIENIEKEESIEKKKDAERGCEEATARYDRFIDLIIDLAVCTADCGQFTRDSEIFREHMHEAPIHIKRSFYRNFSKMFDEIEKDIMGLTAELVALNIFLKKMGSDDKEHHEKGKDKSHPKSKKENSNLEKK